MQEEVENLNQKKKVVGGEKKMQKVEKVNEKRKYAFFICLAEGKGGGEGM